MDEIRLVDLIFEVLGERPLSLRRMTFGHNSLTYDVTLPDHSVMLRTNPDAEVFRGTARNLQVLGGLGLPVPRLVAIDLSQQRYPFAYMILEKIPGRDLRYELPAMTRPQMSRVAEQVVDFQRRVAKLPEGSGFGYVSVGEAGPFASWLALVQYETVAGGVVQDPELADLAARLRGLAMAQYLPYFEQVRPVCFLDDLTVKNVIVQDGELQGVVDFDVVCYGDPLFTVALTATGVASDVGERGQFYVEELYRLWGLNPFQRQVVALYAALFAVDFVRWLADDEPPEWRERMVRSIQGWAIEAEGMV